MSVRVCAAVRAACAFTVARAPLSAQVIALCLAASPRLPLGAVRMMCCRPGGDVLDDFFSLSLSLSLDGALTLPWAAIRTTETCSGP